MQDTEKIESGKKKCTTDETEAKVEEVHMSYGTTRKAWSRVSDLRRNSLGQDTETD